MITEHTIPAEAITPAGGWRFATCPVCQTAAYAREDGTLLPHQRRVHTGAGQLVQCEGGEQAPEGER